MEKIPLGIVGLNVGGWLARSLRDPPAGDYVDFAAVCDVDREKADRIGAKHGVKIYYRLDDLLADKEIPAVGLFTNPNGRSELIRKAIRAGKDVIATKPFDLDPDAAGDVLAEAARLGRVVHTNSPAPLPAGPLKVVKEWETKYDLGRPVGCRRERWTHKREVPSGTWLDDPEQCPAAPITRVGIYLINDLVRLLGPAEKVHVMTSRIFTERPTPDNAELSILYKNKAIANLFVSFCVGDGQSLKETMTLNYDRGTVYYNHGCMGDLPPTNMSIAALDKDDQPAGERIQVSESSHGYQWEAFHRAVNGEKLDGEVTPDQIVEGVKVLAAVARSAKSGRAEMV